MPTLHYRIRRRAKKSADWLQGWWYAHIVLNWHRILDRPITDLNRFERRIPFIERREFSQNGEDGIIRAIFTMIGITNKYYVEFGVEDGMQCNSRYLLKNGWNGLLMDGSHEDALINLHCEFVTAENIESLFQKYNVPNEFDLLSIDIDSNDYWVWKAIENFRPRVVVIEYNSCFGWEESKTIPYDPSYVWEEWGKTDYMGATLQALVKLGVKKGYTLVATDSCGVNAFFVRNDLLKGKLLPAPPEMLYHPAAFKGKKGHGHPPDPYGRPWIMVE